MKKKGFSLIEVVISIAVILISVSGLAFIGKTTISKNQLDICVNRLVQDLHTTRMTSTSG